MILSPPPPTFSSFLRHWCWYVQMHVVLYYTYICMYICYQIWHKVHGKVWWGESLENLANNKAFAKLKPSKLFHRSVHLINRATHSPNFSLPTTFDKAIRQTLSPPNIPAIQYVIFNNTSINFSVAAFSDLSDIHKYLSSLPLPLSEKQAGCNSPHICLMVLYTYWFGQFWALLGLIWGHFESGSTRGIV